MRGEVDFALGYSEAQAGTDLASLETRAVLDGDAWVINGHKMWNTGAHTATHNWIAVRTEPEAPQHKGISLMIVPMDAAPAGGVGVSPGQRPSLGVLSPSRLYLAHRLAAGSDDVRVTVKRCRNPFVAMLA